MATVTAVEGYLGRMWKCRYFWLSLVQMDLRSRYRNSALGIGWSLMQPLALTTMMCIVFHKLFGLNIREYAPSLMTGICFWSFLTASALQGCHSLIAGEMYIRQFPTPIAIFPLRVVLGASFHFLMAFLVVLGLSWLFRGFDNLTALPALIPAFALTFVLCWSLAVLGGIANAYFRDSSHIAEILLQLLFYATPIIYPAELLEKRGLGWMADLNPLSAFLDLLRAPVMRCEMASLSSYGIAGGLTLVMFGLAILVLSRTQRNIVNQL